MKAFVVEQIEKVFESGIKEIDVPMKKMKYYKSILFIITIKMH